ncbi:MAG: protein-export chaperone SecB [Candidatus Portiera sp.]|nr:protein-export chaperone SecB [Portiera sp.]
MNKVSKKSAPATNQKVINLQKIYVRDISLEVPNAPHIFGKEWRPKVDAHINISSREIGEGVYESSLKVDITAKNNSKIAFIVEITQCGSFLIKNLTTEEISRTLGITCPNTLFPYARETLDNLLLKGGMPPMHLAQINFNALYDNRKNSEQQAGANQKEQELKKKLVIESPPEGRLN